MSSERNHHHHQWHYIGTEGTLDIRHPGKSTGFGINERRLYSIKANNNILYILTVKCGLDAIQQNRTAGGKIVTEYNFYSSPSNFVFLRSGIENCEIIISSDNFLCSYNKSPGRGEEKNAYFHFFSNQFCDFSTFLLIKDRNLLSIQFLHLKGQVRAFVLEDGRIDGYMEKIIMKY